MEGTGASSSMFSRLPCSRSSFALWSYGSQTPDALQSVFARAANWVRRRGPRQTRIHGRRCAAVRDTAWRVLLRLKDRPRKSVAADDARGYGSLIELTGHDRCVLRDRCPPSRSGNRLGAEVVRASECGRCRPPRTGAANTLVDHAPSAAPYRRPTTTGGGGMTVLSSRLSRVLGAGTLLLSGAGLF